MISTILDLLLYKEKGHYTITSHAALSLNSAHYDNLNSPDWFDPIYFNDIPFMIIMISLVLSKKSHRSNKRNIITV